MLWIMKAGAAARGVGANAAADNRRMRIRFTKMQGAGNDFVVLDETRGRLNLSTDQYRWLADRHFGVGADQILSERPSPAAGIDFEYIIHNADGGEVEHCGNGARCFVRFVRERGLTDQTRIKVKTVNQILDLHMLPDGRVTVDMGAPIFDLPAIPFEPQGLEPVSVGSWQNWPLEVSEGGAAVRMPVAVLSMGNPHAVLEVQDVDTAPVTSRGPLLEHHPAFPRRVNVGFMQVASRATIRLRVWERGSGETLACGTGACAAVVAGIRLGRLDRRVDVQTRGGLLTIEWEGEGQSVRMTGPATTVFEGEVEIPG
jgi:diaminopimelate epimerase